MHMLKHVWMCFPALEPKFFEEQLDCCRNQVTQLRYITGTRGYIDQKGKVAQLLCHCYHWIGFSVLW